MKESEYFQKAASDADYRHQKILELREHAHLTGTIAIIVATLAAAYVAYQGIAHGIWFTGSSPSWGSVVICAWMYTNTRTRLAALVAMDGQSGRPTST